LLRAEKNNLHEHENDPDLATKAMASVASLLSVGDRS
jgi:hypothetical protein